MLPEDVVTYESLQSAPAGGCGLSVIAAIVLDVSSSMSSAELEGVKQAARAFVEHLTEGDFVTINIFNKYWNGHGEDKNLILPPTRVCSTSAAGCKTVAEIGTVIDTIRPFGESGTWAQGGVHMARSQVRGMRGTLIPDSEWAEYRKVMVIGTDASFRNSAHPTSDPLPDSSTCSASLNSVPYRAYATAKAIEQSDLAWADGITVFGVCTPDKCDNLDATDPSEREKAERAYYGMLRMTLDDRWDGTVRWETTNDIGGRCGGYGGAPDPEIPRARRMFLTGPGGYRDMAAVFDELGSNVKCAEEPQPPCEQ